MRSMDNLPVEIFHRIFDHLDIETIFFSIRPVCRFFRLIVQNYDRLDFHLKIISKTRFDVLCRLIPPENIRSLTLYNNEQMPDQISLFLSRIRLRQLTKLHSVDLDGIDEFQLNYLFKRINLNLIKSFSIQIGKYDNRRRKTTVNHLSTIVKRTNLRKIHFNIKNNRISEIEWPMNCSIQCLILDRDITFDNLVKIYSCSPELHRLIVKDRFSRLNKEQIVRPSFPQLTSLILEDVDVTIDQLESFLLLTPSLISLKLLGRCEIFDGKRWEDFIQRNHPHLNRFEFDIICDEPNDQTREDLELIIESYRSPFWIEHKKWFIALEMNGKSPDYFHIYSIPMCKSLFFSDFKPDKILLSTSNEISMHKNISELIFTLERPMIEVFATSQDLPYFPNVTKVHIDLDEEVSINLIDCLGRIINLSQLIEVKLESFYLDNVNENHLYDTLKALEQSSKLSILIIISDDRQDEIDPFLNRIIPILPRQINHLLIPIKEMKQIEMIFERCPHLTVGEFSTERRLSREIVQWFEEKTIGSIVRRVKECDTIWIGKKKEENDLNQKRMKFDEE